MIKLKDLLNESEEFQQLPTEMKKHFLEIISTFGQFGEQMRRKSDIRKIAETLGGIADAAQEYTLREGGDWFDRVTIKRNMKELKSLHEKFQKEAMLPGKSFLSLFSKNTTNIFHNKISGNFTK